MLCPNCVLEMAEIELTDNWYCDQCHTCFDGDGNETENECPDCGMDLITYPVRWLELSTQYETHCTACSLMYRWWVDTE